MERLHNGSSEEGWPKESSEEILAEEKHREEGRSQENSKKEGDQKAPLALAVINKKAGHVPAFLFIGTFLADSGQREYRALANSTILLINAGYSTPCLSAAFANSLFVSR